MVTYIVNRELGAATLKHAYSGQGVCMAAGSSGCRWTIHDVAMEIHWCYHGNASPILCTTGSTVVGCGAASIPKLNSS